MSRAPSSALQFGAFLRKYTPSIQREGKRIHTKLRALVPGATELVYDNWNGLVVGFGPSEKASHAVLSILFLPKWVTLCFLYGVRLRDPEKRLRGGGNQVRNIRLMNGVKDLDDPYVRRLIHDAIDSGPAEFTGKGKRRMVIKSISPKQRPRRP